MAGTSDPLDRLPPWDAAGHFQPVREGSLTLVMSTATQLVKADPNRVGLIVCATGAAQVQLSMRPDVNGSLGMQLASSLPIITMLFKDTGPLCQQAWYVWSMGTPTVTFYEITLARWPRPNMSNGRKRNAATARAT